MTEAVIVSTARTPLCKSWRGALNMTHGAKMGGHVVHAALERAKVEPQEIEDVIMGCATPEGATGGNIARQIAIRAGLPKVLDAIRGFQKGYQGAQWKPAPLLVRLAEAGKRFNE